MAVIDLSTGEALDAGVAIGTLSLAVATGWLAKRTSDQATATTRLAEAAERQLELTTEPSLRLARVVDADTADIYFLDERELLALELHNAGAGSAEVRSAELWEIIGDDGMGGMDKRPFGSLERRVEDLENPEVKAGHQKTITFELSDEDRASWTIDSTLEIRMLVRSLGSGREYFFGAAVSQSREDEDQWRIDREWFNSR